MVARHNAAFTDCDAKACYDRVIPTLIGQTFNQCIPVFPSGINTTRIPHGQGATDAPPNWMLISNVCQKAY
eukprot:13355790-Ditylum_brightwellii.AAC.2